MVQGDILLDKIPFLNIGKNICAHPKLFECVQIFFVQADNLGIELYSFDVM